jgi:hypothetical protein
LSSKASKGSPNPGPEVIHKKRIMAQPERRQGCPRALVLRASIDRIQNPCTEITHKEKDYGTAREKARVP